jgi:hypothetical protein
MHRAVVQIFGLTDAPGVSIEAISVDETYYDLLYARRTQMSEISTWRSNKLDAFFRLFASIDLPIHQGLTKNRRVYFMPL